MRTLLLIAPLLLAAVAWSQDAKATPDELVAKLGHEDYAVREQATEDLIERGESALPALEQALQSDDLEVRLRAGRAIRAIRSAASRKRQEKKGADPDGAGSDPGERPPAASWPGGGGPRASRSLSRDISIRIGPDGKVKVRQRVVEDGKEVVKEYEGDSLEQLKAEHPELREVLGGPTVLWRFGFGDKGLDPQLEGLGRNWGDSEFWKQFDDEWRAELERIQRWREQALRQLESQRRVWDPARQRRALPAGQMLGIRAVRAGEVLDAQLGLRGRGIVAEEIEQGSLAERLGMVRYDVLVSLNGRPIVRPEDVRVALLGHKKGDGLRATVLRRAKRVELSMEAADAKKK